MQILSRKATRSRGFKSRGVPKPGLGNEKKAVLRDASGGLKRDSGLSGQAFLTTDLMFGIIIPVPFP